MQITLKKKKELSSCFIIHLSHLTVAVVQMDNSALNKSDLVAPFPQEQTG